MSTTMSIHWMPCGCQWNYWYDTDMEYQGQRIVTCERHRDTFVIPREDR